MKKAKVAMIRQASMSGQQQDEPAYVACASPSSLSPALDESSKSLDSPGVTSGNFSQNGEDVVAGIGPVKVSVKNTFIQFEVASSPKSASEPPLRTTPGDYFRKFFQTREPEQSSEQSSSTTTALACPTPMANFAMDSDVSLADTPAVTMIESTPTEAEHINDGLQAHALGQCIPCAYFWYKKDGCRKGEECEFCHLCNKGEIKKRKKHRIQQLKAVGAYIPGFSKIKDAMQEATFSA